MVGWQFSGTPYEAGVLELAGPERLICNLQKLDCVTFVESSLAIARISKLGQPTFESFQDELRQIRYRDGRSNDYANRFHYFYDWVASNERRGLVHDMTAESGGVPRVKAIHYMTSHRTLYPRLADSAVLEKIRHCEEQLSKKPFAILPKAQISAALTMIRSGDILAIASATAGLDVSHVGIAHRDAAGAIRLLHASSVSKRVELSEPLLRYLRSRPKVEGLLIIRPL
ncbi:MAG: DUF1460 domain-containing protein [Cyanobacteria bacterium NC_groundwater_1444_Ag_S-0.65um_54_12]|nr:DUF1460 domain-containing protein [Cyanobacteria bacterium NC_groundwater_1444_Ag_S-0.65um_54_12]